MICRDKCDLVGVTDGSRIDRMVCCKCGVVVSGIKAAIDYGMTCENWLESRKHREGSTEYTFVADFPAAIAARNLKNLGEAMFWAAIYTLWWSDDVADNFKALAVLKGMSYSTHCPDPMGNAVDTLTEDEMKGLSRYLRESAEKVRPGKRAPIFTETRTNWIYKQQRIYA